MITNLETDIQMSLDDFKAIRDFIHEKSGIFFPENKMYLVKNRLQRRMVELDIKTVRDYLYHVKYDVSLKEFNQLMVLITTNETSFFRNLPQLLSFSDELLPQLIDEKIKAEGSRTIRIWSAGCSTGEEPYTLAIILLERLGSLTGWNIEIIANDISEQVLHSARKGEYSGMTLRNIKPGLLERYFVKSENKYRVKPEVKNLVKFSLLNLNDPRKISMMSNMDVIYCRNVMIYFSDEAKKQLVRGFLNSLRPGGYFYIGHSETLHGISKAFKLVYFKNALVYHKEAVPGAARTPSGVGAIARTGIVTGTSGSAAGTARALDLLSTLKQTQVSK